MLNLRQPLNYEECGFDAIKVLIFALKTRRLLANYKILKMRSWRPYWINHANQAKTWIQHLRLSFALLENLAEITERHDKLILWYDNGRLEVAVTVENYLETLKRERFYRTPYSSYLAPSNYWLVQKMQTIWEETPIGSIDENDEWLNNWTKRTHF